MSTAETELSARTEPTERVRRLREGALADPPGAWQAALHGTESMMASVGESWWVVRRGLRVAHILRSMEPEIRPDDLIVGRIPSRPPTDDESARLAKAHEFNQAQPVAGGQSGHMAPDFDSLLSLGCSGVRARIDGITAGLDPADPESTAALAFYRGAREGLEGLCDFSARYADEAERLAGDDARGEELREIATICRRVPAQPARSFHEAIQAAHFLLLALNIGDGAGLTSPGSIDRWLARYLEADLDAERITRERAQELLDCFFLTFNAYISKGLAIGLLVGGRDAEGADASSDLTWMALHATDHTRLSYPGVGLRVHRGIDPGLIDLSLEILAEGMSHPALFNDEVITASLEAMGLPPEDACDYMNSTCVEITPSGKSNVWVASPYFNLPQVVLDIVADAASGSVDPPASLDATIEALSSRLGAQIASAVAEQNRLRHACMAHRNFPLASCFVEDCIERGLDIDQGGARYNWIECSFVGLATAADSLESIRRFVLEGELTWGELQAMLDADFDGNEPCRQRMIHEPLKYGNGEPQVDGIAARLMDAAVSHCRGHRVVLGGTYEPGLFAWITHGELGRETGATPDGRRAGECLSPGPDPMPGRATSGPTAAARSVTSFDHQRLIGGVAFNLKFSPGNLASTEQRKKLAALVWTYLDGGGFQTQINAVSADTLRAAQANPEQYADLLVRVAGYSDYFVHMTPLMQDELIGRTESEV